MLRDVEKLLMPALFSIFAYKIAEAPMRHHPFLAELVGACGGCLMILAVRAASDLVRRGSGRSRLPR